MGQRIREFDWVRTPLGHPSAWSVSLKTAVGIMLNSGAPGYIAWGSNFIQLYNDAYVPILGEQKHAHALGATTAETWHELWKFVGPLFNRVINAGEILSFTDQLLVMQRSGYSEECYFSFSYSPLTNESGDINGVFVTAWETTDMVINRRRDTGLKMLAETLSSAKDMNDLRQAFEALVVQQPQDLPFGMWYEFSEARNQASLIAAAGMRRGAALCPETIDAHDGSFYSNLVFRDRLEAEQLAITGSAIDWDREFPPQYDPRQLYILPLKIVPAQLPNGILVFGMNTMRADNSKQHRHFEELKVQIERTAQRVSHSTFELQEQQYQFESVMQAIPCMVWMSGPNGECTFFNQAWLDFRGRSLEQESNNGWAEGIHADDLQKVQNDFQSASDRQEAFTLEYRLQRADGAFRWILDRSTPRYSMAGDFLGYIGICLDMTDIRSTTAALLNSEVRYRQIVETAQEGIWLVDAEMKTTFVNPKMAEMLGSEPSEMIGRHLFDFIYEDAGAEATRLMERRRRGMAEQHEFCFRRKDGSQLWAFLSTCAFTQADNTVGVLAMVTDITQRRKQQMEIEFLATHDVLTQLPNRGLLHRRIEEALAAAMDAGRQIAVLFIDFDRFKSINDSYGHSFGDLLLRAVAARLEFLLHDDDTVARLGGDEFVMLLRDRTDATQAAVQTAQSVINAFHAPMQLGERELSVTASIGIGVYPAHARSADELLQYADTAMYCSKQQGRNGFQVYRPEMSERALARAAVETALHRALELRQFELHYQPQIELATGRLIGCEALLRWRHPELGMVSPVVFIPVAEEVGLINAIGAWVLETACAQNSAWQKAGLPPMVMSVNLSAVQLQQPGLVEAISRILEKTGLASSFLDLEITESMLLGDTDALIGLLKRLRLLGVTISLDDFGTGYSNLAYLKRFPLTRLKIDRSFVNGLPEHKDSAAIAKAIVNMGHSLGFEVLAEGIEMPAQAGFLQQLQCDFAQGYLFGKPRAARQFESWIESYVGEPSLPAWPSAGLIAVISS